MQIQVLHFRYKRYRSSSLANSHSFPTFRTRSSSAKLQELEADEVSVR